MLTAKDFGMLTPMQYLECIEMVAWPANADQRVDALRNLFAHNQAAMAAIQALQTVKTARKRK